MEFVFDSLVKLRNSALKTIEGYSEEQLNKIPTGFGNNILWNLGHMVASQQRLCYMAAGLKPILPETFIELYRNGTSPRDWTKPGNLQEIKEYFELTSTAFPKDFQRNLFSGYKNFTTSSGYTLQSIEDAAVYNYAHENLHFGVILSMKKLV